MWPFEEELEQWFEQIELKRKAKFGGGDDSGYGDDTDMMQNGLTDRRR